LFNINCLDAFFSFCIEVSAAAPCARAGEGVLPSVACGVGAQGGSPPWVDGPGTVCAALKKTERLAHQDKGLPASKGWKSLLHPRYLLLFYALNAVAGAAALRRRSR